MFFKHSGFALICVIKVWNEPLKYDIIATAVIELIPGIWHNIISPILSAVIFSFFTFFTTDEYEELLEWEEELLEGEEELLEGEEELLEGESEEELLEGEEEQEGESEEELLERE